MNADNIAEAKALLETFITSQPGIFKERYPDDGAGAAVADFCAGFIRKYSEHLEQLNNPSAR